MGSFCFEMGLRGDADVPLPVCNILPIDLGLQQPKHGLWHLEGEEEKTLACLKVLSNPNYPMSLMYHWHEKFGAQDVLHSLSP